MVVYNLLTDGSFVAGDTVSERTSYAYPTSEYADWGRCDPARAAETMMANENSLGVWRDNAKEYDAQNWERLKGVTHG